MNPNENGYDTSIQILYIAYTEQGENDGTMILDGACTVM